MNNNQPFACIHIAGTNGKGSTANYIGSILRAAGHRCGVYTSPHLVSPAERIAVNGENIPEAKLERLLKKYGDSPTFFHAYTEAALDWFAMQKADYAVIETGLGGRKDPTSAVMPVLSVFTRIGMDHMQILGDTLGKIAYEKCGILKEGVKALSAPQRREARVVLEEQCREKHAPLTVLSEGDVRVINRELAGQVFDFTYKGIELKSLEISMLGMRQPENAALAAAACLECGIAEGAVRNGLKTAMLPARFETIPGDPPVVIDGAHNVDSAQELKETLGSYFPGRKAVLLTAIMADKDIGGILDCFSGFTSDAYTVKAEEGRGAEAEFLASELVKRGVAAEPCGGIEEAYKKAAVKAKETGKLLVICGSFYLAGSVKKVAGFTLKEKDGP